MRDIVKELVRIANQLDEVGAREQSDAIDGVIETFAGWQAGTGMSGSQTPEERAHSRALLSGEDYDAAYVRFLAEEKAKDAVSREQPEKKEEAPSKPQKQYVMPESLPKLKELVNTDSAKRQEVLKTLVPALNKEMGLQTYNQYTDINTILEHAATMQLIPKEEKSLWESGAETVQKAKEWFTS